MRYFLAFVLVLGISAPAFSASKCIIGRKCGWEIKFAPYAKTIPEYDLFLEILSGKHPAYKQLYSRVVSSKRAGEAGKDQQEIYLLSTEYKRYPIPLSGPVCKFHFKGSRALAWWTSAVNIKCSKKAEVAEDSFHNKFLKLSGFAMNVSLARTIRSARLKCPSVSHSLIIGGYANGRIFITARCRRGHDYVVMADPKIKPRVLMCEEALGLFMSSGLPSKSCWIPLNDPKLKH